VFKSHIEPMDYRDAAEDLVSDWSARVARRRERTKKSSVRRKLKADVLPLILIVVLLGLGIAVLPSAAGAAYGKAHSFNLTSIDGAAFSLSDFRGKVVLLDLMATWCPVCKEEMPELVQLHEARPEVVIITISVDPTETDEMLREFKETYGADWLFARDTDHIWTNYRNLALPTFVVIDPGGGISLNTAEALTAAEFAAAVDRAYAGGDEVPEETEPLEEPVTVWELFVLAFLTGLFSFFSPCAFPLMPGYISYYLGRYEGGPTLNGSVKAGIAAATGINGMFALIGGAVALGGMAVKSYVSYLAPGVGIAIILLGVVMLIGKAELFAGFGTLLTAYSSKFGGGVRYSGLFLYGVGYGLAAMGCQAPIFIALIFAGLAAGGALKAFFVFFAFSLGMGCMMLVLSVIVGTAKMKLLERIRGLIPYINRACGLILILVGAYFLLEFV
jgi:cytochrome c-type biogenesis protein